MKVNTETAKVQKLIFCFIGDIFGKVGRKTLAQFLPNFIQEKKIDFIVANVENTTNGKSLSYKHYQFLKNLQIDVFTSGNHIFAHNEALKLLKTAPDLLRPANYSPFSPGRGSAVFFCKGKKIRITNLSGRTFMPLNPANPFLTLEKIFENDEESDFHFVDFHAEATAEKIALAWAFDGKITGLFGTHTHVPTADGRILPRGTFFLTDLGMTGAHYSLIGAEPESIIHNQKTGLPFRIIPAKGVGQFCAMLLEIDIISKKIINFQQIYKIFL